MKVEEKRAELEKYCNERLCNNCKLMMYECDFSKDRVVERLYKIVFGKSNKLLSLFKRGKKK